MNKNIVFLAIICLLLFACNKKDKSDTIKNDSLEITKQDTNKYLTIVGNQIWIRNTPKTGDVILKLDDGAKCIVLEKGEQQTINGISDFWYKIKYNEQEGWVFGSQTSLRQMSNVSEEQQISEFFKYFIEQKNAKKYENLKNYFIEGSVFIIYNPGAVAVYTNHEYKEALEQLPKITLKDEVVFGKFPEFDMDKYDFTFKGIFCVKETNSHFLTDYSDIVPDYYPEQAVVDYAKKVQKYISYKLIITQGEGITFYFGNYNGTFKIIAIDITTHDA